MKNLDILLIAIMGIFFGFYFTMSIDDVNMNQNQKGPERLIMVKSDSMQSLWKEKLDSLTTLLLKIREETKELTATRTIKRYEEVPKVVWLHDTLNIDTCKQSLVYYHTELKGCKILVDEYKIQSKEKTKHIDQLEVELTKCGAARKKAEKKNKVRNVWGGIKNAGAGLLGWILGRNLK